MFNLIQLLNNTDLSTHHLTINDNDQISAVKDSRWSSQKVDPHQLNRIIEAVHQYVIDHDVFEQADPDQIFFAFEQLDQETLKINSHLISYELQNKVFNIACQALLKEWNQTSRSMDTVMNDFTSGESILNWQRALKSHYLSKDGDLFFQENALHVSQTFFKRMAMENPESQDKIKEVEKALRRHQEITSIQIQGHPLMGIEEGKKLVQSIFDSPQHSYNLPAIPQVEAPQITPKKYYSEEKLRRLFRRANRNKFDQERKLVTELIQKKDRIPGETLLKLWETLSLEEARYIFKWPDELIGDYIELPKEDLDPYCQTYIVRKQNWNKNYHDFDQHQYMNEMHHTVKVASLHLNQGFFRLICFLADRRNMIGGLYSGNEQIGRMRRQPMHTNCGLSSPYPDLIDRFIQNAELWGEYFTGGEQCWGLLGSKKIPLQQISTNQLRRVWHTDPKYVGEILEYIGNELYPRALAENDPEKLIEILGRIYWWICQAKPWELGDPSIAECLIRAIWISKGFENAPWNKEVVPWKETCIYPENLFAQNFRNLFEWQKQSFTSS